MNACHASPEAKVNANSESQVGRLATFEAASRHSQTTLADWQQAYSDYEAFANTYSGRTSAEIASDMDVLDPASLTYEGDLAALETELLNAQTYETRLNDLGAAANDKLVVYQAAAEQEHTALAAASGGRELSEEAINELQSCLND